MKIDYGGVFRVKYSKFFLTCRVNPAEVVHVYKYEIKVKRKITREKIKFKQ
jgi:hypothetical protein